MTIQGKLRIEWRRAGNWKLTSSLLYKGEKDLIEVPQGFVTDFASVPAFMRGIFDDNGPWILAAIIHDYLLFLLAQAFIAGTEPAINSRDADGIFRRIMREEGVSFGARWTMWAAVRVASLFTPSRAYGRGFLADLPKILIVAVPAVILFTLYAVVTLFTRTVLRILNF